MSSTSPSGEWKKQLGKIESVYLGIEDHGILTCSIQLAFGGSGQGFGGLALDGFDDKKNRRIGTAMGLDYILSLLQLFKVDTLDKLVGRSVFALRKSDFGRIEGIELPEFDGGGQFIVDEWRAEWGRGK